MPEGPELHLSSFFINRICKGRIFSGKVVRNPIHKCADIAWDDPAYFISAESRGKELMLHLCSQQNGKAPQNAATTKGIKSLSILFTFGMSGKFEFTPANALLKHSHLTFFTKDEPKMALSFVDHRRFGKWIEGGIWSAGRGPCVIQEYHGFVNNIVKNLNDTAFNKPICEVMLNQKFFNGIGNYLRAEILYRCKVPPFERASSVLQLTDEAKEVNSSESAEETQKTVKQDVKEVEICKSEGNHPTKAKKAKTKSKCVEQNGLSSVKFEVKSEQHNDGQSDESMSHMLTRKAQELLKLCNTVPLEVVQLGSTKYSLSEMFADSDSEQSFHKWIQCYCKPGMKNMADHNKRTMWFSGPPGPLVPKEQKSRAVKKSKKTGKSDKEKTKADAVTLINKAEDAQKTNSKGRLTCKKLKDSLTKESSEREAKAGSRAAMTRSGKQVQQTKRAQKKSMSDFEEIVEESIYFKPSPVRKRSQQKKEKVQEVGSVKKARMETVKIGKGVKGRRVTRASIGQ